MRLDKYLSNNGFGSRKDVKILIKKQNVYINNVLIKQADFSFDPTKDIVKVNDIEIEYKEFYYFLLNKPKGYISATEDYKQNTVLDLLPEFSHLDLFPVGRLDKDTTGTLLITNDGQLAHALLSPKKHVDKVFIATLDKDIPPSIIKDFENGIILDNELTLPAKLEILEKNIAKVTLHQGKYHQVKRMFLHFNLKVIKLHREKFAFLTLEDLKEGQFRELTKEEVEKLKVITNSK